MKDGSNINELKNRGFQGLNYGTFKSRKSEAIGNDGTGLGLRTWTVVNLRYILYSVL